MQVDDRAFVTGGSGVIGGGVGGGPRVPGGVGRAPPPPRPAGPAGGAGGAEPVHGDIEDEDALRAGADGCRYAFHAAAKVEDWGDRDEFERVNVDGTTRMLRACRAA